MYPPPYINLEVHPILEQSIFRYDLGYLNRIYVWWLPPYVFTIKVPYLDIHQLYGTDVVQDYETNVPMFGDIRTANTPPPTPTTSSTTTTTTTTTTTSSAQAGLLSTMKKTWNIPKTQKMKMLLNFAQYLKQTGSKIQGVN